MKTNQLSDDKKHMHNKRNETNLPRIENEKKYVKALCLLVEKLISLFICESQRFQGCADRVTETHRLTKSSTLQRVFLFLSFWFCCFEKYSQSTDELLN